MGSALVHRLGRRISALNLQSVYTYAPHIIVTALATLSLHANHAKYAAQDCAPTPAQTCVSTLACGWP